MTLCDERPIERLATDDRTKTPEPQTEPDFIARAGALLDLKIAPACRPGIATNLDLLQSHAAVVAAALKEARP